MEKNHISSEMARELIPFFQNMYHSWFLVYQRVLLQLHLQQLRSHHLHHRNPYLMSTDTPNIQYPKEVEVRVKSFGETRCMNPQKPKNKNKDEDREEVHSEISHELSEWLQEFRENLVNDSSPGKSLARVSRHFQFFS